MDLPRSRLWTHNWPHPGSQASAHLASIWHLLALQEHPADTLALHVPVAVDRLLKHASERSRAWKARTDQCGLELANLPVTTRAWIRNQVASEGVLQPRDPWGDSTLNHTSGSSGQPLSFYVSGAALRFNAWVDPMQHVLRGRDLGLHYTMVATKSVKADGYPHWPDLAGMLFPTGHSRLIEWMGRPIADIASMLDTAPQGGYISCSASILSGLCDHYEVSGGPAPPVAEFLTRSNAVTPALRERTRRLFGATVADVYSCEEIGAIAHDCKLAPGNYHVLLGNAVVEIVDEQDKQLPTGAAGRVLLTGLNTHATPFIRYDVGDRASMLPACPCGWTGPTLTDLVGRQLSLLKLPGGGQIYALLYATHWLPIAPVREYRLVQDAVDHLRVELVTAAPLTDVQRAALVDMLRERTSPLFRVSLLEVEQIAWGNGKRNEVVCLVP